MKNLSLLLCLLATACSNLPPTITDVPISDIQVNQVNDKSNLSGHAVRWGGIITEIENDKHSTSIQVLSYPLGSYGRPVLYDAIGRFYLKTNQFLDPAVYVQGAEITVYGILNGDIDKTVGDKTLTLPVVDAQDIHLWRRYRRSRYDYPNYWPHSYGYYGHGYYPHGRFHFGHYRGHRRYYGGYRACY